MSKISRARLLLSTLILIILVTFSTNIQAGTEVVFPETKDKLAGMDQKEMETLQKLFSQVQEIEEKEKEVQGVAGEIDTVKKEIDDLQGLITEEEMAYAQKKDSLKQLLQSYQRMGPGSYLEIVLESKDLTEFLRRINTLREITRNTGELLAQLQSSKEKLATEKTRLNQQLASMEDKQTQLAQSVANQKELKKALEVELATLSQEKVQYKQYLSDLQQNWDNLKPSFSRTAAQFTRIIEEGSLPPDAFQITYGIHGLKGSIADKKLNEILASYPELPKMFFSFRQDQVELSIPEHNLSLKGTFDLQDGHSLRFLVTEGSFSGMPLLSGAIEDLFQEGEMKIDFNSLLGGFTLHSVELKDGFLELSV